MWTATIVALLALLLATYVIYPWQCRRSATAEEALARLPGDDIVQHSRHGYTLAITIAAPPAAIWPWLVQIGQGRAGFYTHEWVERLLRAEIKNADRIIPALGQLTVGDRVRLTPDPYFGKPGQFLEVARVDPNAALILKQQLPNGGRGTWSFVLRRHSDGSTRLLFRHRGTKLSAFDYVAMPGFYFMDRGMLKGIKRRVERTDYAVARRSTSAST